MKKKILTIAILIMCAAICASGTIAYFTAEEKVHNVITTSKVDIAIEEWQEIDGERVPYPEEPIVVMPATTVSKIVTVKNVEAKSYIRARVELKIFDAEGKQMELTEEELTELIMLSMGEKWSQKEDEAEWWYYDQDLAKDEVSEPLFTEVVFSGPNMTNKYQNCTVEVIVDAQAVQAANNGENVLEAAGWPEE